MEVYGFEGVCCNERSGSGQARVHGNPISDVLDECLIPPVRVLVPESRS